MFIQVRKLSYDTQSAYAPPDIPGLVNVNDIARVRHVDTRRIEPCVEIRFLSSNESWVCLGTVEKWNDTITKAKIAKENDEVIKVS